MPYCSSCGEFIKETANYCKHCGKKIIKEQNNRNDFGEEVLKCPICGEMLSSFESRCKSCGCEIRGAQSVISVKAFYKIYLSLNSKSKQIDLIRTFPIPNTREDLIEFYFLALTNLDVSSDAVDNDDYEDSLNKAWSSKLELTYQKALIVLKGDPCLEERIY